MGVWFFFADFSTLVGDLSGPTGQSTLEGNFAQHFPLESCCSCLTAQEPAETDACWSAWRIVVLFSPFFLGFPVMQCQDTAR